MKKLRFLFVILSMLFLVSLFTACSNEKLTLDDIEYTYEIGEFWSVDLNLTCAKSVEDLSIEYVAYNDKGVIIRTGTKYVNKIVADKPYRIDLFVFSRFDTVQAVEIVAVSGKIIKPI